MLTDSRDIILRLEKEGWRIARVTGSHHHFAKQGRREIVTMPHPRKGLSIGTVKNIYWQAGWEAD